MEKAIGSKVKLNEYESFYAIEFGDCVDDLLEFDEVKRLDEYFQHCNTSRLQHSINVAYYSYLMCKILHFDYRSAARAGLLHDLFWYDWRTEKQEELHAFYHPKEALRNAKKLVSLNKIEEDAIKKHMWPLVNGMPKYKESYIVTLADKYCATVEIADQLTSSFKSKLAALKSIITGNNLVK